MTPAIALALLIAAGVCQVNTWRTEGDQLLRVVVCALTSDAPAAPPAKPEPEGDPA